MSSPRSVQLPAHPALALDGETAVLVHPGGEIDHLSGQDRRFAADEKPYTCHTPAMAARLGVDPFPALDVLELFAFVYPATFCVPTSAGLAEALGLEPPESPESRALTLIRLGQAMLETLVKLPETHARRLAETAWAMARGGWPWGPSVLAALGVEQGKGHGGASGLRAWLSLSEWEDRAPPPPPSHHPLETEDVRRRLDTLTGGLGEERPAQAAYAAALTQAFQPKEHPDQPRFLLAEAGTGTGKTLGYVAPASIWAEQNEGAVWVSTYTRNLQRQLDQELDRLFPDPEEKRKKVVVRKGRENYLCLLNFEEAVNRIQATPESAVPLGLIARWVAATRDGDMVGGDFPGWLRELFGPTRTVGLTDRRGECIYGACAHYQKCFVEKTVRRARRAELVVANHALVMVQAAMGGLDDAVLPTRYVFDEGHHLFDAADSAFGAHLSGLEAADLRRWLLGAEGGGRSRARGLKKRLEEIADGGASESDSPAAALDAVLHAARCLPSAGWRDRLIDDKPHGPSEEFLALVRQQVLARAPNSPYDLETETEPLVDGLADAALKLETALSRLEQPLRQLMRALLKRLDTEADELDTSTKGRIEGAVRSLDRRGVQNVSAWRSMLAALQSESPEEFVDWFGISRIDGRDIDVGLHRHWVDPTLPFARTVADQAHGVAVTSATLTDGTDDPHENWGAARARTGANHLETEAGEFEAPSPFTYAEQSRVFIVTDVRKDDLDQVAAAYRSLFLATGGGGLGLFTAISRLKAVHERIAPALTEAALPLYAQHVDAMDIATLTDIFRAEEHACLLGTDAVRDGVDVPGNALRLLVFDRVPWPRPTLLHKARRAAFGKRGYDDMLTRLKIKQAFGRLIRRADDRGVFVLLDPMMPSRLLGAFPDGTPVERVGLAEAVEKITGFLSGSDSAKPGG